MNFQVSNTPTPHHIETKTGVSTKIVAMFQEPFDLVRGWGEDNMTTACVYYFTLGVVHARAKKIGTDGRKVVTRCAAADLRKRACQHVCARVRINTSAACNHYYYILIKKHGRHRRIQTSNSRRERAGILKRSRFMGKQTNQRIFYEFNVLFAFCWEICLFGCKLAYLPTSLLLVTPA